ncbi:MAG: STAS domain-containing protein [Phycisphaerales bacterium]|nr:STAS domain-containing protein [Phycisphaerales bacterium]
MPIDWSDNIILADLTAEPELAEELSAIFDRLRPAKDQPRDRKVPSVVLNFASVSYVNSSHIAALLRMRKRLIEVGRSLVLCSLNDDLWTMMGLTGLDKVFQFAPDTMTALARVQIADQTGSQEA